MRLPGQRLALLAGLLLWLSHPPVAAWPLAWLALAPLILSLLRARSWRQAAWRAYVCGFVSLGAVWYWVGLVIVFWTGSTIGWLAWVALTLAAALFYAAWGGVSWWLARRLPSEGWRLLGIAAAWVVMEWTRALTSISMPWAQLTYTQYRFLPALQIIDVTGAHGVSFLILLFGGALAFWRMNRGQPHAARWVWTMTTVVLLVSLYGLARLWQPDREGRTLTVAAMQGNFSVFERSDEAEQNRRMFRDLTQKVLASGVTPSVFVWSESAASGDALNNPMTRFTLAQLARESRAALITGTRVVDYAQQTETNSSLLFPPDGGPPARYDKRQLVAFGEFIPYRHYLPEFLKQSFKMFEHDVVPGTMNLNPLRYQDAGVGEVALGPLICYETMYPYCARHITLDGATLLVNQSNDAWFQSHAEMEQHLAAAVMRAIETRRDMVRATTTGVTSLLDARGHILARAPYETPATLVGTLRLREGITVYARCGDWLVALCGALLVVGVWKGRKAHGDSKHGEHGEKTGED